MTAENASLDLTLQQLADEAGVPRATLSAWVKALTVFSPRKRYGARDVVAARAIQRLMRLPGATLESVASILEVAGPAALDQLGRAQGATAGASPARALQESIRQAAAAGLFGEVLAEVGAQDPVASESTIVSLGEARMARLMARPDERRKSG